MLVLSAPATHCYKYIPLLMDVLYSFTKAKPEHTTMTENGNSDNC